MRTYPKSVLCALALSIAAPPAAAADGPEVSVPARLSGAGPFLFQTAEQSRVKVEVVARGLVNGYSLAFLPNGDALVVERGATPPGRDRRWRQDRSRASPTTAIRPISIHPMYWVFRMWPLIPILPSII